MLEARGNKGQVSKTPDVAQKKASEGMALPAVPVLRKAQDADPHRHRPDDTLIQRTEDQDSSYSASSLQPFQLQTAKPNNTGLPTPLKTGIETLSGFSLDDVKVHYNSDKPAQLQAYAYAKGTDIHVGPGHEQHLPHEAWHVVQQKQGRVRATMQLKGANINDDEGLEQEADVYGAKAMQVTQPFAPSPLKQAGLNSAHQPAQRDLIPYKPAKGTIETEDQEFARKIATKINDAVMDSYREFLAGNYKGASDAQIDLYKLRKFEFDKGEGRMHPSTAAGYVIEGKANSKILAMDLGVELSVQITDLMKATRPDIGFKIPREEGKDEKGEQESEKDQWALVDITASDSGGHIFAKKGNWTGHQHIVYVAECVYPTINFLTMKPIVLSEEDLAKIKERADIKQAQKLEFFELWSKKYGIWQDKVLDALNVFNSGNREDFNGTSRQKSVIKQRFQTVGIDVKIKRGDTDIEVTKILPFTEHPKTRADVLVPYKIDTLYPSYLASLLKSKSMSRLVSGNS